MVILCLFKITFISARSVPVPGGRAIKIYKQLILKVWIGATWAGRRISGFPLLHHNDAALVLFAPVYIAFPLAVTVTSDRPGP
jgi:hypothetical protein